MTTGVSFDSVRFWQSEWAMHAETVEKTRLQLSGAFDDMLVACVAAIRNGNKIMFAGNGGSAADAQHLATEMTVRYRENRPAIAALALTTDTSALTAIGNDFGFEYLFSRQVEALARSGDVLVAISTSGNSPNIIKALETARAMGVTTIGFTGQTGGQMKPLCDIALCVPSAVTARIQEMHISFGQMLCGALEQSLGYATSDFSAAAPAEAVA